MNTQETYHDGELKTQIMANERSAAIANGRIIASRIPQGALRFLAGLQYGVVASTGADDGMWATFLVGRKGFVEPMRNYTSLRIHRTCYNTVSVPQLQEGQQIGVLFIDFATRRRLRVNGVVEKTTADALTLAVQQAYPNCRKYIQRRPLIDVAPLRAVPQASRGTQLDAPMTRLIANADTVFVASGHPDGSMDASHRGGEPGFIEVRDDKLRIPDYPGNSMFNTLGNFMLNPTAGLTFVDFSASTQLQLTGSVEVTFDKAQAADRTAGTGRFWTFAPRRFMLTPLNATLTWGKPEPSPFNL